MSEIYWAALVPIKPNTSRKRRRKIVRQHYRMWHSMWTVNWVHSLDTLKEIKL